jgi:hypothetical protein
MIGRQSVSIRWGFIITFIKLFEPHNLRHEVDPGFIGAYWCVEEQCSFINLCKWAKYE